MKIPYGFQKEGEEIILHPEYAEVVQKIYALYLEGRSLGKIAECLEKEDIPSPSGNQTWGRAAIDKLLSNSKYTAGMFTFETFAAVQFEKDKRSNKMANGKRKPTRYQSTTVGF